MRLSEMREVLAERGIRLTKSLGQHFLHDGNQLRRIVALAELKPEDRVLEVGPGLGSLTALLLTKAGDVFAIERDLRLVSYLRERFADVPHLCLIPNDALQYLRSHDADWSAWKLVANLPYSVASPILVELARAERRPERMVVTLQLEVARRIMAHPGSEDYGRLTLVLQLHYRPSDWFRISAGCFFPEPEVDSACLCLVRRAERLLTPEEALTFTAIVKRSFSQRRKQMFKLLRRDWPVQALTRAFEGSSLSPDVRAEAVSVETFAALSRVLHSVRPSEP